MSEKSGTKSGTKSETNRQWLLKTRPVGMVSEDNFELAENPMPEPADGEALVKLTHFSFEPAMRGWMTDLPSYMPPIELGAAVTAPGLGEVIESKNPKFKAGDLVMGLMSWSEYFTGAGFNVVDKDIPPELAMGPLGGTGMTAYIGLTKIGEPKAGDTVLVSGAAGATGSVAAQIAKNLGCKTIGIAGGKEKCDWLVSSAKLDAVIDYKSSDINQELKSLCPEGINVYFENVGGKMLETAIDHLAEGGRIVFRRSNTKWRYAARSAAISHCITPPAVGCALITHNGAGMIIS